MKLYGRERELRDISAFVLAKHSFILYGPQGVGKTALLDAATKALPDVVRISSATTAQQFFAKTVEALWDSGAPSLRRRYRSSEALLSNRAANLKGICLRALGQGDFILVIEHASFTSQQFSAAVKQTLTETGATVVFATRSIHMEDGGYLVRFLPERSDHYELRNLDRPHAVHLASLLANDSGLTADNRPEFLDRIVELSGGNPGAMVNMIRMAASPRYRSGESIKTTPLYIDFRLMNHSSR